MSISRRDFICYSAGGLTGLFIAFHLPLSYSKNPSSERPEAPNAFIHIRPDNTVELIINRLEMGQGIHTSLAMLIAEELDLEMKTIVCRSSGPEEIYNDPKFHVVTTQGSLSINHSWEQYRKIGAGMRIMLLTAAAIRLNVKPSSLRTENGHIIHGEKKIPYGELVAEANKVPFPNSPELKKADQFKVIGHTKTDIGVLSKIDGSATFGSDIRLPGMLFASLVRPVAPSLKLKSFDRNSALAVKGIRDVFVIESNKIVVIGTSTYNVLKAKDLLAARWEHLPRSSDTLMIELQNSASKSGLKVKETSAIQNRKSIKHEIKAEYSFPYLAHAPMETLNCTIDYDGKKAVLFGGFQRPTHDLKEVSKILNLKESEITLEVTYAGGSFGRRDSKDSDWVKEAAIIGKKIKKPVHVFWDRSDDLQGGYYRPMACHKVLIAISEKDIVSWKHHIAGHSILRKTDVEGMLLQGVVTSHYQIPGLTLEQSIHQSPVPTLWWRSVGHSHTAFVMETLIDEICEKLKKDPFEFRLQYLEKDAKAKSVIEKLKIIFQNESKKVSGKHALGIAIHTCSKTAVGYIAEVSVSNNKPKIHKVWAAINCGKVVNPSGAAAQIEGGIVFGLSSLFQEITIKDGMVREKNFDDYQMLRFQDMPEVECHFIESDEHPTGLGEPGVPPIAPAVVNALYKLTGKRLRKLPLVLS